MNVERNPIPSEDAPKDMAVKEAVESIQVDEGVGRFIDDKVVLGTEFSEPGNNRSWLFSTETVEVER